MNFFWDDGDDVSLEIVAKVVGLLKDKAIISNSQHTVHILLTSYYYTKAIHILSFNCVIIDIKSHPGFILTRPKWITAPMLRSSVGFNRSISPIDTPPVVIKTSTLERASLRTRPSSSLLLCLWPSN